MSSLTQPQTEIALIKKHSLTSFLMYTFGSIFGLCYLFRMVFSSPDKNDGLVGFALAISATILVATSYKFRVEIKTTVDGSNSLEKKMFIIWNSIGILIFLVSVLAIFLFRYKIIGRDDAFISAVLVFATAVGWVLMSGSEFLYKKWLTRLRTYLT